MHLYFWSLSPIGSSPPRHRFITVVIIASVVSDFFAINVCFRPERLESNNWRLAIDSRFRLFIQESITYWNRPITNSFQILVVLFLIGVSRHPTFCLQIIEKRNKSKNIVAKLIFMGGGGRSMYTPLPYPITMSYAAVLHSFIYEWDYLHYDTFYTIGLRYVKKIRGVPIYENNVSVHAYNRLANPHLHVLAFINRDGLQWDIGYT